MKREWTDPINPATPKQIGDVVGIDRMDSVDREKLDPRVKLQLLAEETKRTTGRDPRAGGYAFVARPRIVLQILLDLGQSMVGKLRRDNTITKEELDKLREEIQLDRGLFGDSVAKWSGVPIIVRCTTANDELWCLENSKIPRALPIDHDRARLLRDAAWNGLLEELRR
jgi:hypothetical protein